MSETKAERYSTGPDDEYLTVPEAAEQLRVAESTVWRWIAADTLPAYRLGRKRVLIRRTDLASTVTPVRPLRPMRRDRAMNSMTTARRKAMIAAVAESRATFAAARAAGATAGPSTLALLDESRAARDRELGAGE